MWSGVGHRIVWYMVMNALKPHPGCPHRPSVDGGSMS
jgi:hypothetical protein